MGEQALPGQETGPEHLEAEGAVPRGQQQDRLRAPHSPLVWALAPLSPTGHARWDPGKRTAYTGGA